MEPALVVILLLVGYCCCCRCILVSAAVAGASVSPVPGRSVATSVTVEVGETAPAADAEPVVRGDPTQLTPVMVVAATGAAAAEDGVDIHTDQDTNESHLHETVHLLDSRSLLDDECVPVPWVWRPSPIAGVCVPVVLVVEYCWFVTCVWVCLAWCVCGWVHV